MPATRTTECRWQRLTAALAQADRAGGHRLDSQQILDLLWMATLLAADICNQPTPPQPPASPPAPESAGDSPSTPAAPDSTSPPPPYGSPPDRGPLAPTQDAPEDDPKVPLDPAIGNQTQAGGWPRVSVAEPGLLPHPRRLGRALAPLNRQVETGSACHLDVPATVEAIARARAERGPWQPVLLPRRQGWLALHLVFDGHTSMVVWERLRRELPRCLSQQVQWRDLRCWTLSRNPGGTMELRGVNGRPGAPGQLRRPGGRDLVLVVSDLLAPSWRDGAMAAVLHDWAEVQPVLLLQVLPSRLWRRTGLTAAEGGWVQARQPLQHHARLQWQPLEERPFWPDDATASPPPGTVTLPLTTLDPRDLAAMAGLLTAAGGNSLRGFRFELSALASVPPEQPATSPPPPSQIPPAPPSDQRIEELLAVFLFTASLDARRLLALLTYAPLITLPVVRLVLNQQGGAGGPAVIAEVLFSGLFRNVETASTTKVPIDQQQLCFVDEVPGEHLREGLRERLREGLRVGQARAVFQAVEQYVAQSLGLSVQGFEALLRDPNAAPLPGEQLADKGRAILRAFAMVSIRCLRGLGPDFEQRADVYETTWATAAAEEIPEKGTMGGLDLEPEVADPSSGSVSVQTASVESILHLHIYGPTGIGKTRLALELCRQAAWADFVIYVPRALNVDLLNLLHGFAEGGNSTSRSSSGSNSSASSTDSSGPSKAMQIANLSLSVSPERIARLTDIELGELMAQLLKAQSYICGAPVSEVRIESDELLRDQGEDAWTGKPKTPDEWLGDVETCWQLKAGKAGTPARIKDEISKPLAQSTLKKYGRFVLVASGSTSGMKGESVRLRALTAEAAAAGLPTDRIVVIGSERLAEWVNQHPAIAARRVNRPDSIWTLKDWTEQNGHEAPWQAKHSLSKEVEKFRQALDPVRTSKGTHPGVRLVLVADYTPGDRLPALRDALDFYKGRLRLITIGYEPPPETRRIRNLKLEGLDQQNITELVAFWNPSLTDSQVLDVIEVASGNPLHARMAADELSRNPTLNTDELRQRLEERLRGGPERVNFPRNVRLVISQRVGGFCSKPGCNIHTTGPHSEPGKVIDTGVAAHITAAAPGGPRFSPYLTNEERKSHDNGIWLCQYHAKLIDSDPETYPEALLREWKAWAEQEQQDRVLGITRGRFDWTWPGAWDFGPYRTERRQGFMGRDSLLRKVRAWATDPEAKQAMLIQADFGVGKTAFLAQLIDGAGSGLLVVAQHFCRWEMNACLSPGRFVQSLAAQLKEELPAYRKALEDDSATSLRESLNRAEAEPLIAFNQAVVAPLAKIPAPATRRLLVIDALDEALDYRPEAGGSSRYTIVDLLAKEARNLPPWLRVLATSRRRDEVLKPLRQSFFSIEEINFDEEANLADIHDYVKVRCQQEPLAAILNRADLSVSDTADLLQAKSGGKFLYAVRMLNDLASGALTLKNRHSLDDLPPGMDGFYADTFQRRFPEADDYNSVKPLLALLCAQREPMVYRQLAAILEVSTDIIGLWIEPLQDLLRFQATSPSDRSSDNPAEWRISFEHASLDQWLTEGNAFHRPRAGRFGLDRLEAEQQIRLWALGEVKAGRAHTSPYLVRHLASHLRDDERPEVIAGQLRQFDWLVACLHQAGIQNLLEDLALAASSPELDQLEQLLKNAQMPSTEDGHATSVEIALQLRSLLPDQGPLGVMRVQADEWLAIRIEESRDDSSQNWRIRLPWPPPDEPWESPFPGLPTFERRHAAVFFGQDTALGKVQERITSLPRYQSELVWILGASGCGKSSLLRAGLLPWLAEVDRRRWIVLEPFRPGVDPWCELNVAISQAYRAMNLPPPAEAATTALMLQQQLSHLRLQSGRQEARVVVAIDQFEELLERGDGHDPDEAAAADTFLTQLAELLAQKGSQVLVIATMRSDFLFSLKRQHHLDRLEGTSILLRPMDLGGIRQVIEGPALRAGLRLELGLCDRLVRDTATGDALPLLAFTLRKLWDKEGPGSTMTLEQYQEFGGIDGVVQRRADEVIATSGATEVELEALRRVFIDHLVRLTSNGQVAKQPARLEALPVASRRLVGQFVAARLLVSGKGSDGDAVEIAHEALLRTWEPLVQWLEENQEERLQGLRVKRLTPDLAVEAPSRQRRQALEQLAALAAESLADGEHLAVRQGAAEPLAVLLIPPPEWGKPQRTAPEADRADAALILALIGAEEPLSACLADAKAPVELRRRAAESLGLLAKRSGDPAQRERIERQLEAVLRGEPLDVRVVDEAGWKQHDEHLPLLQGAAQGLQLAASAGLPLLGSGPGRVVPMLTLTALEETGGLHITTEVVEVAVWRLPLPGGEQLELVAIPGGEHTIGSPADERDKAAVLNWFAGIRDGCRDPRTGEPLDLEAERRVELAPFWLLRHPISQRQWLAVVKAVEAVERELDESPGGAKAESLWDLYGQPGELAVNQVSWNDCQEWLRRLNRWLSEQWLVLGGTGEPLQLALPGEGQWEAACRAGTATPFHFGDTLDFRWARYDAPVVFGLGRKGAMAKQPGVNGGCGLVNRYGLAEMHGQLLEWCGDSWHPNPVGEGWHADGLPWEGEDGDLAQRESGQRGWKLLRGGSWLSYPLLCRAAFRNSYSPYYVAPLIGLRPGCCPSPPGSLLGS